MADFLIFIDTNILLDFYRVRGRESGLLILKHIDENLPRFITSSQVEMEFKKHRQRVILESLGLFKPPDWGGLQLPAFISESKQSKALTKNQNQVKKDGLREEGLAICCGSCNSSRGRKTLLKWFQTGYCLERNPPINEHTVAEAVKRYLSSAKRGVLTPASGPSNRGAGVDPAGQPNVLVAPRMTATPIGDDHPTNAQEGNQ